MNNLPEFAYLENTLDNSKASYYFSHPKAEVLCTHPDTLNAQLEHLWSLQQQGLYLVGFVSYEAAYYLNPDFFLCNLPVILLIIHALRLFTLSPLKNIQHNRPPLVQTHNTMTKHPLILYLTH
jgi:hypothetical protein